MDKPDRTATIFVTFDQPLPITDAELALIETYMSGIITTLPDTASPDCTPDLDGEP